MIAVRRDRNALVFFSRKTGTKVRLALGKYESATRPELVDLKITDYCDKGCSFCYMGSTTKGSHASSANLSYIVSELAKAKVFEVAIGGGEPTYHPDFLNLLDEFRANGIVPNFTTRNVDFVIENWERISKSIGAFAVSISTMRELLAVYQKIKNSAIPKYRVNVHYVMGLHSRDEFIDIMRFIWLMGLHVTLLGYKSIGRGANRTPIPYGWLKSTIDELVKRRCCPTLSIDTPLAAELSGSMPVSDKLYHTREGFVSMYVDAVALTYGASSFENTDDLKPFNFSWRPNYILM